ncbi:DNA-binding transcriptional regulator, MarR family [Paenibacillus sophorae]|uniref:DNA-binding transcriptional regulator, MarR family n=1 Tax=Paenibacillus sophorae TaxID=1333845 RepID=A0A1H8FCQ2_9BACL|nr:MarR family transcriptional regulator [Paenibacillus sophorae]QWU13833.1 MarR family transcriptional regulator [Paenibacillus sophorae]SEN29376.1 DNA-binding transcriptional regulator, MarR family [Paenibacillus sophorae]
MNLFKSHGFLLNRLAHIGSNQLEKELLSQFDITLSQWAVLSIVWEEEGIALSRIQEVLDVKVSTASGVLKRMEKKGLILRSQNKNDKREIQLFLTEKSKKLEKEVIQTVKDFNKRLLADFSPEEKALFTSFIQRGFNNLKK